jgi:hypothetical protein
MDQATLGRRLLRCRYLVTRAVGHRLGIISVPNADAFVCELHRLHKKAAQILIDTTLELEADLRRATDASKNSREVNKYRHWLASVGSCCETFVEFALRSCDVPHLYKGPRFGFLDEQNVHSVLKVTSEINESQDMFAFPLDFTRFSCTGDVLCIARTPESWRVAVVEIKEGEVNDAVRDIRKAQTRDWSRFVATYGLKGLKQARRVAKQELEFYKRYARMQAGRGIHKDEDGMRVVLESEVLLENFLPTVEDVCRKARRGEYAVDVIDGCLMVAAGNATSMRRAMLAEVDARLFALNAFGASDITMEPPKKIAADAVDKITLIDWLDGLGSQCLMPLFLRPLRARTFLDLIFGRMRLLFFFHPPTFVELLRKAGVRAELLTQKETNRLRSVRKLRESDLPPLHEGRAIAFYIGATQYYMGSARLHQMVFNWACPRSLVAQMADAISTAPDIPPDSSKPRAENPKQEP